MFSGKFASLNLINKNFKQFNAGIILAISILLLASYCPSPNSILDESIITMQQTNTASYTLLNRERINNELLIGRQFVKWSAKPFKCYLYFIEPNQGAELLYCEGEYENKAVYFPNGFPYVNLFLDPLGDLMRRNNHHSIFETGLTSFIKILSEIKANPNYIVLEKDNVFLNGVPCLLVEAQNSKFIYTQYTLEKNTSLRELAKEKALNEYLIALINNTEALKILNEGTKVSLSNSYAKKIKVWINKQDLIPIAVEIYDDSGLFEHYELQGITLNPSFTSEEFSMDIFGKHNYN